MLNFIARRENIGKTNLISYIHFFNFTSIITFITNIKVFFRFFSLLGFCVDIIRASPLSIIFLIYETSSTAPALTKIIFEGPKELLNETENTQPAIFLVSYAIYETIRRETSFDISKANLISIFLLSSKILESIIFNASTNTLSRGIRTAFFFLI